MDGALRRLPALAIGGPILNLKAWYAGADLGGEITALVTGHPGRPLQRLNDAVAFEGRTDELAELPAGDHGGGIEEAAQILHQTQGVVQFPLDHQQAVPGGLGEGGEVPLIFQVGDPRRDQPGPQGTQEGHHEDGGHSCARRLPPRQATPPPWPGATSCQGPRDRGGSARRYGA
jgi:hypothetical protein